MLPFLMGLGIVVDLTITLENVRPECSMTKMRGVEWVVCR